jgi:hypothetical protein
MYFKLLDDPYFQVSALESVLSWLQDETARVEDELLKPEAIDALLKCFVTAKANSFENLLDPFLKITRLSTPVTIAMTKSSAFFKRIIDRLGQNSRAVVRLNLLRILRGVCEVHPNRAMLVERYGLLGVVEKLSRGGGDGAVLVRELAREIVPALKPALRPVVGVGMRSKSTGTGSVDLSFSQSKSNFAIAPKRLRRAASEASPATPLGSANVSNGLAGDSSFTRLGTVGKIRPPVSAKPASASSRQRLGDIPWQNTSANGSGGGNSR